MPRYHCLLSLLLLSCSSPGGGDDPDAALPRDATVGRDVQHTDAAAVDGSNSQDAGGGGVTSTLVATGCPSELSSSRVIVHYNTSLGIVFTDPDVPYAVRGTIAFDFPSTFTGGVPNPYSWVESGIHKEVALTDQNYTTWGNHCWPSGETPTGGSATIAVIDGPAGVVQATFQGFQLRNCVNQNATCTLSGTIESSGTGVFE